jgi:hypothetical protein
VTEAKSKPKWKRALWLALKIYAGLCTLLITAYLFLVVWTASSPKSSSGNGETMIMASYGAYAAREHPKRADYFSRLAATLSMHCKEAPVAATNLLTYLGNPDLIYGTLENGTLAYFYDHHGATNRWVMYADLKEGKLAQIGFNDVTVNDHSGYRPYSTP